MKTYFVIKETHGSFELLSLWPDSAKAEIVALRESKKETAKDSEILVVNPITSFKNGRRV